MKQTLVVGMTQIGEQAAAQTLKNTPIGDNTIVDRAGTYLIFTMLSKKNTSALR
jgi:hypothetical protein